MRRADHLRNDINPNTVKAKTFDVKEGAVQIQAAGLAPGQSIPIEIRVVGRNVNDGVSWAPLVRNGCPVVLSETNTSYVEIVRGTYRIGAGPAVGNIVVSYEEDEAQGDERISFSYLVNPPCDSAGATPPTPPSAAVTPVTRCDATTGAAVTLLVTSTAGVPSVAGHIGASGTYVAGPYPGTLGSCLGAKEFDNSFFCDPVTGDKVLVTTTYSSAGVPTVAGYNFPSLAPYTGALGALASCPEDATESDAVVMCDGATTFFRWVVKENGQPTGVTYDTTLSGAVFTVAGTPIVGACNQSCLPVAPVGLLATWG